MLHVNLYTLKVIGRLRVRVGSHSVGLIVDISVSAAVKYVVYAIWLSFCECYGCVGWKIQFINVWMFPGWGMLWSVLTIVAGLFLVSVKYSLVPDYYMYMYMYQCIIHVIQLLEMSQSFSAIMWKIVEFYAVKICGQFW